MTVTGTAPDLLGWLAGRRDGGPLDVGRGPAAGAAAAIG